MKPRILLAGLGETGSELARRLVLNWDVIGVDPDEATFADLPGRESECDALVLHKGDATSALMLRKTDAEGVHGVVACTGSDETNYEMLRLAKDLFGIKNRVALMYTLDWKERYEQEGIEVVSQDYACAAVLESRVARGQKVASDIGLGEGEIMEVEVLPNSSVVGTPLMDLNPKRWIVGAVYRGKQLIVPHGDTVIQKGDRVLIIGDPGILPSIATLIRTGESEFPLQHGSHVVGLYDGGIESLLGEVGYLIESTRADRFEVVACSVDEPALRSLSLECEAASIPYEYSCSAMSSIPSLVHEARSRDVGVLVLPPEKLSLLASLGLGRSRTARIIDMVSSPVLVARKTFPYRNVLLVLAELPFNTAAAQLAIDLVRMVDAELHLGVVHQPELVVGAELREEIEQKESEISNLAGLYHVKVQKRVLDGNPIREIQKASGEYDLLVMPYRRNRKAFLTRPDVGLNLVHRAACSVMVMPV